MIIVEINETIPNLLKPSAIPYINPSAVSDIYAMINKIIIVIFIVGFYISHYSSFIPNGVLSVNVNTSNASFNVYAQFPINTIADSDLVL